MEAVAIWSLVKKLWWTIPMVTLGIGLATTRMTLANVKEQLTSALKLNIQLEDRNKVTQGSLTVALAAIDTTNEAARKAGEALKADVIEARTGEARADERYKTTAQTVAALRASAKATNQDPCAVSQAALEALKEL